MKNLITIPNFVKCLKSEYKSANDTRRNHMRRQKCLRNSEG